MKKIVLASIVLVAGLMSFTMSGKKTSNGEKIEMPENVKKIVDAKCLGCHSEESHSTKAKMKLKFDDLSELSKAKLISKLDDIAEELEKGKMPPKKFVEKHPDKSLTEEEAKAIIAWANSSSDDLMK